MKTYLNNLASNNEGKKLLLTIYYAMQSKMTDSKVLCDYLEKLKNNNTNIASLELKQKNFEYNGELLNIFSIQAFQANYFDKIDDEDLLVNLKYDKSEDFNKKTAEDIKEILEDFQDISFKENTKMGPPGNYIWVTKKDDSIKTCAELGVEKYKVHIVGMIPPIKKYILHYPTAIEGYKNFNDSNKGWHYGNANKLEEWGCTVDIHRIKC